MSDLRDRIAARRQARGAMPVPDRLAPSTPSTPSTRSRTSVRPAPPRTRGFLDSLAESVQSFLRRDVPVPTVEDMAGIERGGVAPTIIRAASGLGKGIPGAVLGAGGELSAQLIEGRDDLNWTQIGTQGALGALPFKRGATAAKTVARGAGSGALMTAASEAADQYHEGDLDLGRLVGAGLLGGGIGAGGGGLLHMIAGRRAARAVGGRGPSTPAVRPGLDPAKVGGPEHAADVIRRVRARKGLIQYPRGTDPAVMIGRSADTSPAAGQLGGRNAVDVSPVPDGPVRRPSDLDVDAPLSVDELARAAEPTPPPARPSPAARRRARRAKLEAAIREAGGGGGTKPRYTAEQVAEHRRAAGYEDLAPDDVPSLAQAARRFPSLPESDLRTLLEKYAFERTQIETPQRPKIGFDDFIRHERKALAKEARVPELDDRWDVLTDPHSERGAISQDLLFDIASPLLGAAIGAPLGAALDDDDQVGTYGGAAAGALAGLALRRPSALATLQYGSMLSSPVTMLKGITGSTGSVIMNALEHGDLGTVARNMISRQTMDAAKRGFVAGGAPGRYKSGTSGAGSLYNPLRFPGRVLGAADEAAKDVLVRSGRNAQEAGEEVMTGTPRSRTGKGLLKLHFKTGAVGETILPFARTIMNALERGLEATPGVGFLPSVRNVRGLSLEQAAKKQGLGAIAALIAAAAGEQAADAPEGSWERRLWDVTPIAMGPMAVPAGLAYAASKAAQKPTATPYTVSSDVIRGFQGALPTPEVPSLRELLSRAVPRDLSEATGGDAPSTFDTSSSHFAPLIARIPKLNEYLLRRKRSGRTTTSATRSHTDRRARRESRSRER